MAKFRFQDLAPRIGGNMAIDIADDLEIKRLYRFAEQLRGSGLSMSNNIAEGSGSDSNKDFQQYLGSAKSSSFENANVIIILDPPKVY